MFTSNIVILGVMLRRFIILNFVDKISYITEKMPRISLKKSYDISIFMLETIEHSKNFVLF